MRIIAVILFAGCLFLTLYGYHFLFEIQLSRAKSEMKNCIPQFLKSGKITKLKLNVDEAKTLEWENENEFKYKDEMYDVIERHTEGNSLIINCIPDNKETIIVNEYLKLNKGNNPSESLPSIALIKIINTQFLPSSFIHTGLILKHSCSIKRNEINYYLPKVENLILTPPPKEI